MCVSPIVAVVADAAAVAVDLRMSSGTDTASSSLAGRPDDGRHWPIHQHHQLHQVAVLLADNTVCSDIDARKDR